jgi:hypothetical protein
MEETSEGGQDCMSCSVDGDDEILDIIGAF